MTVVEEPPEVSAKTPQTVQQSRVLPLTLPSAGAPPHGLCFLPACQIKSQSKFPERSVKKPTPYCDPVLETTQHHLYHV